MGRYRYRKKRLLLFPVLMILVIFLFKNGAGFTTRAECPVSDMLQIGINQEDTSDDWNLILVKRNHRIPKDYEMKLTELSNGQKVDSRIYPELQVMFDAARADGLQMFVREGYRTSEEQQQILDEKIESFENEGNSRKEAEKLATDWVAVPGTSEHELGLSVDINADTSISSKDSDSAAEHLNDGGIYISSGILVEKKEEVKNAVQQAGFEVLEICEKGEWCALAAAKK